MIELFFEKAKACIYIEWQCDSEPEGARYSSRYSFHHSHLFFSDSYTVCVFHEKDFL